MWCMIIHCWNWLCVGLINGPLTQNISQMNGKAINHMVVMGLVGIIVSCLKKTSLQRSSLKIIEKHNTRILRKRASLQTEIAKTIKTNYSHSQALIFSKIWSSHTFFFSLLFLVDNKMKCNKVYVMMSLFL